MCMKMGLKEKNGSERTQQNINGKQNAASIATYVAQDASNQLLGGERLAAVGGVDDECPAVGGSAAADK